MTLVFYILIFILGTVIGSFLNVVICRINTNESIIKNRSHCPFCKNKLVWYELIPIISFLIQRGRCRKCGKKISLQYPLVEFFTGIIFLLIFITQYSLLDILFWLVISCFLIILFVYDLKHSLVPDIIIYPAIVLTLGFRILELGNYILASLIAGGFFLVIILVSKGKWMGMGDAKIGILMGLVLGLPKIFVALFLAFLIGAVVSIILLILKKKVLKSEIPFGPFLTGATFIALFLGEILLNWYIGLL